VLSSRRLPAGAHAVQDVLGLHALLRARVGRMIVADQEDAPAIIRWAAAIAWLSCLAVAPAVVVVWVAGSVAKEVLCGKR
jgi:hypothetical protein